MPSYYTPVLPDSPLLNAEAAKRRSKQDADLIAPTGVTAVDPYKGNWAAETTRSQAQHLGNLPSAIEGLSRQVLGDQTGADAAYKRFIEGEQEAQRLGPQVQTIDDARQAGGGIGDYASAIGYQAAQFLPDVALAATGAGLGADVATGVARRGALAAVRDAVERKAVSQAGYDAAREGAIRKATQEIVAKAPNDAAAVSGAVKVATRQVDEAGRQAAMAQAVRIAGRTPRIQKTIGRAGEIGSTVGGAAGFYPATVAGSVPFLQENPGQASALKVGSVDALASLVGSLPYTKALEMLAPEARTAAQRAIQQEAPKFLPGLAKETAKHATGGGLSGVGMTAVQLAGHKWVNDNVDLLGPDAAEKYLDSFVGGAIAGGAFGAGGFARARAGDAIRGAVGKGADAVRSNVREALTKWSDRARKVRKQFQPGDVVPQDGAPAAAGPESILDKMRRGASAVGGQLKAGVDAARSAADRFRQHEDDLAGEHALDEATSRLSDHFESGAAEAIPGKLRAANQNPITGLGGLKDHLMSYVNADSPLWMDKGTANYVAESLLRTVTGKRVTSKDVRVMDTLRESGAVKPEALDAMKVAGEQWGRHLQEYHQRLSEHEVAAKSPEFNGDGDTGSGTMAEQLRDLFNRPRDRAPDVEPRDEIEQAHNAGEGDIVNGAMSERAGKPDDGASLGERVATLRRAAVDAHARAKAEPEHAPVAAEAKAAFQEARKALQDQVYGAKTDKYPQGKNVVYQSSKDAAAFEKLVADPGRVEIDPVDIGVKRPIIARRALSLDTLAAQELGRHSERYNSGVDSQGKPYTDPAKFKAALMTAFGDALQAGVKIKPESITAGEIKNRQGEHLTTLTPADVKAMQGMAVEHAPSPEGRRAVEKIAAAEGARQRTDAHQRELDRNAAERPDKLRGVDETGDPDLHKLVPREVPTGSNVHGAPRQEFRGDQAKLDAWAQKANKLRDYIAGAEKDAADATLDKAARARAAKALPDLRAEYEAHLEKKPGVAYESVEGTPRKNADERFVPSEGVRDVSIDTRLSGKARRAQEQFDRGHGGRLETGIEIGKEILAREREASGNERRYQRDLKRLMDPKSGLAKKFFYDALDGKFDKARVSEKKADKELVDKPALRDERKAYSETPAMEPGPLKPHETAALNKGAGRLNDDAPPVPKKPSAETLKRIAEQNPSKGANPDTSRKLVQWEKDAEDKGAPPSLVKRFMELARKTSLAEKESNPKDWTPAMKHAMDRGDWETFSRLRGYSEAEINDFREYLKLADTLIEKYGVDNVASLDFATKDGDVGLKEAFEHLEYKHEAADTQWDKDGVDSATKAEGPHDHAAETRMLNGILDALGIKSRIEVRALVPREGPAAGGLYRRKNLVIEINDNLRGPERVEVLLHELGHHIVWDTIAKTLGLEHTKAAELDPVEALRAAADKNPELFQALRDDYNKWAAEHQKGDPLAKNVRTSRQPFFRATAMLERLVNDGRRMSDLSEANQRYQLDVHEWLADNIARALSAKKESQSVIGKFFADIVAKLKAAYDRIFADPALAKHKPAESVDKWIQSLFDANSAAIREATGTTVPSKAVEPVIRAAVVDGLRRGRGYDPTKDPSAFTPESQEAFENFIKYTLPASARAILDRVMQRPAAANVLRKLYKDAPDILAALEDPHAGMENRIMLGYLAWKAGKFQLGNEGRQAFFGLQDDLAAVLGAAGEGDLANRIFSDIANGSIQRMHEANKTYDVRQLEARARGSMQRVLNTFDAKVRGNEALSKFWDSSMRRARTSGIPAYASFAAKIVRPQDTTGNGDEGMTPAIVHTLARYETAVRNIFDGMTERQSMHVLDALQRQLTPDHPAWMKKSEKTRAAVLKVRKLMDQSYAYMRKAGINVGERENFFPVTLDLRNDALKQRLFDLYNQPKFEASIREALGKKDPETGERVPSDAPFEELVNNLVDGAIQAHGIAPTTGSDAPNFRGMKFRLSQFIYDHGGEADIRAFAKLQSKNAHDVFARYLGPMVKRAEYTRHFGAKGEGKQALLDEMRKQGATEAQITEADNMLKAALGTYGAEGSPTIAALSPMLAQKLSGPRTRALIAGGQTYQNARLLPLALMSSLVDPMGIAVRTGGDFGTAWKGFRSGVNALFDKANRAELHKMLEQLGAANDTLFVLQHGFGGAQEGLSGKINEWIFKYNGMQAWVLNTRYQALEAAHAFLLKHADGTFNEHSERYLRELGLKPGDVRSIAQTRPDGSVVNRVDLLSAGERQAAPKEAREQDDRVRNALRTFVDQAILRPNSMQRPLWHNDPYLGLISQYKAFGYALYDQIMGRFFREVNHGNLHVVNAALGYVPVVLAAELLREFLQYGGSGNPQRADWGPAEYTAMAAKRTGLLGPKFDFYQSVRGDVERKHLPGYSQMGPSFQQANNVLDALEGRRDLGKEFESALPGSAAFQHLNDDRVQEAQDNG